MWNTSEPVCRLVKTDYHLGPCVFCETISSYSGILVCFEGSFSFVMLGCFGWSHFGMYCSRGWSFLFSCHSFHFFCSFLWECAEILRHWWVLPGHNTNPYSTITFCNVIHMISRSSVCVWALSPIVSWHQCHSYWHGWWKFWPCHRSPGHLTKWKFCQACSHATVGPEPKFEPELYRTRPRSGPKFRESAGPNQWSSLRFRQQNNVLEPVRTSVNQTWIKLIGIMGPCVKSLFQW